MKKMDIFAVVKHIFRCAVILLFSFFCVFSYAVPVNHYERLGISQDASQSEVREAYRRQAIKYHPDKHPDLDKDAERAINEKFKEIRESYEVLSDPSKRAAHDADIRSQQSDSTVFEENTRFTETVPEEERVRTVDVRDLKDFFLKEARSVEIQTRPLENPYDVLELQRPKTETQANRNADTTKLLQNPYRWALSPEKPVTETEINRAYNRKDTKLRRDLYRQLRRLNRLPKDSAEKAPLEQKIDQIIRELQRLYSAHQILSNSVLKEQWDREGRIALRGTFLAFRSVNTGVSVYYLEGYDGKLYDIIGTNDGKRIHLVHRLSEAPPASGSEKHITDVLRLDTTLRYTGDSFENMRDIEKPNVAGLNTQPSKFSTLVKKYKEMLRNRVASVLNRMGNVRPERNLPVVSVNAGGQGPPRTSQLPVRPGEARSGGSTFRASPSQLTWEAFDRMLHPYSENSTHQLKFTEAMRSLPPNMLTFYAAMGAFMFSRTYWDSSTYDGVEIDPEWEQSIVTAVSSPLGLFSFAAFVIVAGQMTRGLEVFINKVVIARSAKDFMKFRGSLLTPNNVEASKKYYAKLDHATKRAAQAIRALRLPLSLSAGMVVSMAIMELNNDPNAAVCWNGVVESEARDYDFISACDRFYQEWNSFIEFLVVTPMTFGALLAVNKWAPQNKKAMAKGIIGVLWLAMMTFEVNGWTEVELENWGKLREWGPMMATMIAAGFALEGLRFSYNKIKKIYDAIQVRRTAVAPESPRQAGNQHSRLSQTRRPELEDLSKKSRSSSLSKFVNTAKQKAVSAGSRSLLFIKTRFGGPISAVAQISIFLFLDYIFHPFITEGMKTNQIGKDLSYKKNQMNSYVTDSWNDQSGSFDFWETEPGPECSMSDPKNMSVAELAGEVAFNSNRNDCPGRYFAHQLDDYSSLFYDWRENQLGKFLELYGTWYRDSSPLLSWYNTNIHVLTSMGILPESPDEYSSELRVKRIKNNWMGIHYHNLVWEDRRSYIEEEIRKMYGDLLISEEERTAISEGTYTWYIFSYGREEDHQTDEAMQEFFINHRDEINDWVERRIYTTLFLIEEGMDRNQITDEILFEVYENRMSDVERFKERKVQEVEHEYYSERVQSRVMEIMVRELYLNSPYDLFKSVVNHIDKYIASRRNSSEFRLNKDILSDIYDNDYLLSARSAVLPEEELVGSLRALFNAVDFNESIYNYYDRSQVERCERDVNCNESVLRARAVSAGVDLLNLISGFSTASAGRSLFGWGEPDYWELITDIREFFKEELGGELPRTYSTPLQFNVFDQGIEQEKEYIRQGKGWFAPLMDGLPAHPMKYVVYQMVCGPDLNSYFPSMEQTCTDQDDLNQLVEELPSADKAFMNTSYMFSMPKVVSGDNIPSGLCDKTPSEAFETSIVVGNRKYRNLLEYVLDSENIRSDIYSFWEDKVESQYSLLMACFEDLYGKIYNNHFVEAVHSEEVYVVDNSADMAYSAPPVGGVPYAVSSYPTASQSAYLRTEIPKGVLASLMNQTELLFDLLKRVHDYDDESLQERAGTVESFWNHLEDVRNVLPYVCEEPEDSTSLRDKVSMSIDCSEKLVMDLFQSFAEQIKIEQCGGSLKSEFINAMTKRLTYIQQHILRYLVLQDLVYGGPGKKFARSDCFSSISSTWCDMYALRLRDTATLLIVRHHLNKVFEELRALYVQVTSFSGLAESAEDCSDMQNGAESIPLIQEVMDEYPEPSIEDVSQFFAQ